MQHFYSSQQREIRSLFRGHRLVSVRTINQYVPMGYLWLMSAGWITLDTGVTIFVVPNPGCDACPDGRYTMTALEAVNEGDVISVRLVNEPTCIADGRHAEGTYEINVTTAEAGESNVLTIKGNDGSGKFGTGYRLCAISSDEMAEIRNYRQYYYH